MKKILLILSLLLYMPAISNAQIYTNSADQWSANIPVGWIHAEKTLGPEALVYTISDKTMLIAILYNSNYKKNISPDFSFENMPDEMRNSMLDDLKNALLHSQNITIDEVSFAKFNANFALCVKTTTYISDDLFFTCIIAQFLHKSKLHSFILFNTENEKIYEQQFTEFLNTLKFDEK